ncbi:MAG: MoxR family ATPase [Erysipelotrichaceae bacterium]|nr:MoxR family ATPase [Erysipelotrichaceae bacterium]
MKPELFTEYRKKIVENCSKVIVGKEEAISLVLTTFLCSGHVLLEDLPGTGKTMLLRSFAKSIGKDFRRVQFTPDLLPSDLTGIHFYNQKTSEFELRKGPLFTNIVLADEINRATPRTQSALLEVMEERQISIDGSTSVLDEPFMVMATQNPLESSGTFPLPDAQLDRFFMRIGLGYMKREEEMKVMLRPSTLDILNSLTQVVTDEETNTLKSMIDEVMVNDAVLTYMMDIIEGTRNESHFMAGVSTRGAMALVKASRVTAALEGRDYVIPEDVQKVAPYVLCHRLNAGLGATTKETEALLQKIISKVQVPLETL